MENVILFYWPEKGRFDFHQQQFANEVAVQNVHLHHQYMTATFDETCVLPSRWTLGTARSSYSNSSK